MKSGVIRQAAVAGSFYPSDPEELRAVVEQCLEAVPRENRRSVAVMVPHAALKYSGKCAAAVFGRLKLPMVVVIVGPDHRAAGCSPGASLWGAGVFATPLGKVQVDADFAAALGRIVPSCVDDPLAHEEEHAIEVELPFLQVLSPVSAVVPILLRGEDWGMCRELAEGLARLVASWPREVVLVASSDLTHYESASRAEAKDRIALDAIRRLDGEGLLSACKWKRITMCGRGAAAVVAHAAQLLGARDVDLVDYRHSGLLTGDHESVVSYAGVMIG